MDAHCDMCVINSEGTGKSDEEFKARVLAVAPGLSLEGSLRNEDN
jgi:hypothetical protein